LVEVKQIRYTSRVDVQHSSDLNPDHACTALFVLRFFRAGFLDGFHDGFPWTSPGLLKGDEAAVG
jgi:hypothetical protein